MKKDAGRHPQGWCQIPFLHCLCSGYRFDTSLTLRKMGIEIPKELGKLELLCSCSCHNRVRNALDAWSQIRIGDKTMKEIDIVRFYKAFDTTLDVIVIPTDGSYLQHIVGKRRSKS